jgi:hypothetical protein
MKSLKILFSLIVLLLISSVYTSCKKEEPRITGCTDKNSVNYNPKANLNDGSCIENNPASMKYFITLSDSACLKNCQKDKIVTYSLTTEADESFSSYDAHIAQCNMYGPIEGIKVAGEYCMSVFHRSNNRETLIKKECFTISQSKILLNQIPDFKMILEEKDACK